MLIGRELFAETAWMDFIPSPSGRGSKAGDRTCH